MNKTERLKAAARIQKAHDELTQHYAKADKEREHWQSPAGAENKSHHHRAELRTLLADAERENDALREYVSHAGNCPMSVNREICTCKLDEILNKGVSDG